MIEAAVFFRGPLTQWSQKVAEDEIIARRRFRSRWLASVWARNLCGQLNPARCGWVVLSDGEQVEGSDIMVPEEVSA